MWRTLADWLLAVLNMTRELEENRASMRNLDLPKETFRAWHVQIG
jgi:hypothetical protein